MAKKRSFSVSRAWQYVGLAVVGAVVLGLTVAALQPRTAPVSASDRPALTAEDFATEANDGPPTAVFLGDSYTEAGQVVSNESFPVLVAQHFGWNGVNLGEGGTGYLAEGPVEFPDRAPFPDRVAAIVASDPDVVIVAGGINDQELITDDGTAFRAAVAATLDPLRAGLPNAEIYVVGPFWPNGYPVENITLANQIISEEAAARGLPFIDPVGGQWITGTNDGSEPGNRVDYIGPDGTHPTAAGHAWIAQRLIESLTAAGAATSS